MSGTTAFTSMVGHNIERKAWIVTYKAGNFQQEKCNGNKIYQHGGYVAQFKSIACKLGLIFLGKK